VKDQRVTSILKIIVLFMALPLFVFPLLAAAQQRGTAATAQPAADSAAIPRDSLGRADLSGIWRRTGGGGGGAASDPVPYKPEALAKQQEFRARLNIDDPIGHCFLGIPRIYGMPVPFKIVQLPNEMIFLHEMFQNFRIVPTDGRPHPEDHEPAYLGSSVGKWEGDTLVIDARGFNDGTWLGNGATHHSDQLQITERFRRTSATTIAYEATITDPVVFTKSWTVRSTFTLQPPEERLREYECDDNNLIDQVDPQFLPKR
jgi:hypothetical protein